MPNWKKVVVSGSDAAFNSVFVTNHVTASGAISSSNSLFFSSSLSSDTSFKTLMYDTSTGKIFHTGSYGGGGGAGGESGAGFPFAGDAVITGSLLISASNNTSSSLVVQGSGSTIFEVQGSQGQLFSITDDLIHSVLEVSDISGDTLFKVSGSGLVEIPVGDLTASSTSTASFGKFIGDGSQLTNIPSPFTAASISGSLGDNAALIRSLTATGISGSFAETSASLSSRVTDNAANLKAITSSLTTAGRMVFVGAGGTLTSEDGFTYNATTNQLAVENLIVTHLTSSFVTASRITTSGSNIFGDEAGVDVQTLIGTTKMSGSAQITGSLRVLGAAEFRGVEDYDTNVVIGKNATSTAQYSVVIGKDAGISSGGSENVVIGHSANLANNALYNVVIGEGAYGSGAGPVAIGEGATAAGEGIAIGRGASVSDYRGIAIGRGATAGLNQLQIGNSTYEPIISASLETGHIILSQTSSDGYSQGGLEVHGSGSTVFEVIGSEGTLFTVTDSLEGSIFAAKDKTGIPILEVFANTGSTDVVEVNQSNLLVDTGDVIVDTGNIKLSGSLNVTGSHINVADNSKIKLGAGGDLEIYHDGSNSYIDEVGTGTLFYRGGTQTFQNAAGTKTMLTLNAASSVDLRFNNSTKLSTTNTGINITGEITASGNVSSSAVSTASFGHYIGDGSQLTGISAGTNFTQSLFVSPSGDNSTAVVGDMSKPFQTILSATASANIGDTIIVYPGTYDSETSNIIKDGVNYYFYPGSIVRPTSTLSQYVVDIEDPTYAINVRGAGTFISDDTNYGAIRIQAEECYFEFDIAKTTNNTTNVFQKGGTVILEPTNADGNTRGTNTHPLIGLGSPFYVKGKIINTGNLGNYAGALVFGRDGASVSGSGIFEGSVMQLHPTTARPAILSNNNDYYYSYKINANVFSSGSEAVLFQGRGDLILRGSYTTGVKATKYAISIDDGYRQFYDIDADINGALKLNTGYQNNSGGIVQGRIRTGGDSPDDCAIYITSGGQHKIDNQIFCRNHIGYGIIMTGYPAQVDFTGDFNADAGSSYINFCKVTTGKLMFKGSLGHNGNRGQGSIIDGGHLVIDSFFNSNGSNYPNNAYAFKLSAGTLEVNNKITYSQSTTGSGIIDMTGGYLKLNGAELIHDLKTGSFAYAIKLNDSTHSGSILNNSFTNLTPFGPGSFTNETIGGGTLFYSDKLY